MKGFVFVSVIAGGAIAVANCSPYNPDLGSAPYKCGTSDPQCPDGYECVMPDNVCVSNGQMPPDSGSSGFQCLDDSGFGMNDTIQGAFQTPVATTQMAFTLASSICPEGDKDTYKIDINTANANLEVIAFVDSGMVVSASILNAGGSSIGNGSPTTVDDMGTQKMGVRACVPNLPVGTYYAQAFASANLKNNYHLSIKIVPNC